MRTPIKRKSQDRKGKVTMPKENKTLKKEINSQKSQEC